MSENFNLTLTFDQYQRYKIIADIINKFRKNVEIFKIIDIGAGIDGNLKKFLPNDTIYFLDKEYPPEYKQTGKYIEGDFTKINLNETYDFVVSLDVYEHIPPTLREKFVNNLIQLSTIATIIAAPFDTPGVHEHEVSANELYKSCHGFDHKWLQEHIQNGLPALHFTLELVKKYGFDYIVIPNGFLPRWYEMISNFLLTEGIPELSRTMEELFEFYNNNFYNYDNINPAYRQVIIISKIDKIPNFSDIHSKDLEIDTDLNAKSEMLENLFTKIKIKLGANVFELSKTLQKKNEIINSLEIKINELETKNNDLERSLQEKNIALQSVYESITWRTLMKFHGLVVLVLPPGSRRWKIYNYGLKSGRTIVNEGWRGIWQKFKTIKRSPKLNEKIGLKNNEIFQILNFYKHIEKSDSVHNHLGTVDIIICVHNALEDVKKCLESLLRYTAPPYSLIIVDDGSGTSTKSYLEEFAESYEAHLIRNESARGYTFASNEGLRFSTADYVVLLNSDTIVTFEWLDRMIECAESDDRTGIVGPLSNTASWQSVPDIETNGDWAQNSLPNDMTIETMGRLIAKYSARLYPEIPFLNGFCLMIKRALINDIGYFDEETFGKGYGEENDYCIRARNSKWILKVSDDVYIFHAQSRSYSNEKRMGLCDRANKALIKKHGGPIINEGVLKCRYDRVLEGIRARTKEMFKRQELIREGKKRWEGKRILTILPVMDPGGGAYVVMQEGKAMLDMGIDARLFNLNEHKKGFESSYPDLEMPVIFSKPKDISAIAKGFDAVISTLNTTIAWLDTINRKNGKLVIGYYIQDFEPYFYTEGSKAHKIAMESYTRFYDLVRITKTIWNRDIVKEKTNADCKVIGPSVDIDLFRPRSRYNDGNLNRPVIIGAMVRPTSPRRGALLTMKVLREAWIHHKERVKIITFGCSKDEMISLDFPQDFTYNHVEVLNRKELAMLLNEFDLFVDFSSYQAMGLTALEAMSCGAAVVVPKEGGTKDFVMNGFNGFIVDTSSEKECLESVNQLVMNSELRIRLGKQALKDACQFWPEKSAYNTLLALFPNEENNLKGWKK